ncbi:hypothetical protein MPAR162_15285 [Methylorubrum populi]|uniref:Uncharacterized protein n=2 Tax=Hyphomicrobiales TaxID=356 RepID=A0ABU7T5Y3_9HYPH
MAQGDPAALKRSIYNILWNKVPEDARQRIAKAICEDWNYCENRSDLADLQSIVYIITSIVSATYIPVCVWVFVVQYKMLDELCGCTDRSMPLNFKKWLQNGGRKVTKKR